MSRNGGVQDDVQLDIICTTVPVITMEKSSIFDGYSSWMLQKALGASGKADSLYEFIDDRPIMSECRSLGLSKEEICIVRLKQPDLKHIKAVGASGKRSVMLACVVALALEDGVPLDELWDELPAYKLDKAFVELLRSAPKKQPPPNKVTKSNVASKEDSSNYPWKDYDVTPCGEGVELDIVCGNVPVVGLYKESVLHKHASWMLQQATSTKGKAEGLYEFINDDRIMNACQKELRLTPADCALVRLLDRDLRHVIAVGTNGKRSIMLACVVAMVANGEIDTQAMFKEIREMDRSMEKAFRKIVDKVMDTDKDRGQAGWRISSSKRTQADDDDDADDWGDWQNSSVRGKTVVLKRARKTLDRQLDAYLDG